MAQVSYGTITITDTNDIERIYVEYCRSTSNQLSGTTVPDITRAWGETTPEWVDGQYIWQRTVVEESGTQRKTYGTPVCISGEKGETGEQGPQGIQGGTGAAGRSLKSTTTHYTTAAATATITQSNMGSYTWSSDVPTYNASTPAYWVRVTNVYENPSSAAYIFYKDNGITDAVKTSHDANSTAASANSTANAANQTANSANTTANNANTKADQAVTNVNNLQAKLKYYWVNEVNHTNGVSGWTKPNYPVGTYAASGISGTTFDSENSSTYGYNTWYANGINLRYNEINLGQLTGTSLTFYHPSTSSQGGKAMELTGSALKFYDSTGSVAQATFGGTQATISGTINVYDGKIGNGSNYWYIGNYTDYNQNDSAIIKSIGTASIQLNETNTWRIATNRIHTAWAPETGTDAYKLHFPVFKDSENNNKHWDFGLHLPTSNSDKFLYIRNAASTQSLDNLLNDLDDAGYNYWTYKFYVDSEGNLHAGDIYSHGTLISGTSAPYLLKSGGTITGDLTVNGTITGTLSGTASNANTVNNLTVQTAVPANAVFTDTKVTQTASTGNSAYELLFSATADNTTRTEGARKTSTLTYNPSTKALLTGGTINGYTLAAASAKGVDTSLTASSTSANLPTSAAVANLIKQYLPLTGGNITGAVTFGSSVSADELTVGDLVVNGAASFTNNLQANTINGVAVGSNPKFTDANVTQTATTGAYAYEVLFSYTADNTTRTEGARKTSTFTYNPNTKALVTGGTVNGYTLAAASAKGVVTSIDTSADLPTSNAVKTFVEGKNYVTSSGVTKVSTGAGLIGGDITGTGTVKANLRSETKLTRDSAAATETANRIYPVVLDKTGYLAVNVPWTNVNSSYLTGITSNDVTTALGYTPYNSTNPNNYITANHTSTYSLPVAKYNTLGGVKPAYSSTGAVSLTTAAATNTTTPTIAAKTTTSNRYYAIEIDKNGVLFVNVPWTNVNSSYLTSSSTLNWNNITQNKPTTASGYGITDAITNVSATSASGGSTTFTLTKSNGTTSSFDVVVYASAASQATDANYLTDGTTRYSVGSAKKPIYFDGGIPKASDGMEGTSTKPVYLSSGTITAGLTYAGGTKVTLNNSDKGASTASFYAPTSGGTSTQVLTGNGTTSAPVWTSISSLVPSNATNATNDSDGNPINTTYLKKSGGTMTGALNTANNTWNKIGDDIQIGDINEAGTLGIQGVNGNTAIRFTTYNQTGKTTGGKISWDGTKFTITGTVDTSISGNAATATTATTASSATEFSSNATVTLTGDTTGTSAGSKKSWSVSTTTSRLSGLGRRSTAAQIALNPSVDTGFKISWHISDSTSRTKDATNSPSFDAGIINIPWDWGAYNGQIALANDSTTPRMQIRAASHTDNGESASPRYTPNYGAWREVVTATKATQMGSSTKLTYINNNGQVTESSSNIGSARQAAYLSSGTITAGNYTVAHLGNAGKSNMNDIGRLHASVGMTNLTDPGNTTDNPMNGTTKSTSWHLYWNANYTDDPNGSNAWVAQIVNKAGTDQWWVRSRSGSTITNGTAWAANWKHLVVSPQAGQGSSTVPIYIDANGQVQSITSYSGNAATATTATTATNVAWSGITSNPITFNSTAYGTTGWSQLGGRTNPLSSIRVWKPTDTVAWGTQAHSAVIAFGHGDTKGMLDCAYNSPLVSIAGGNVGDSTDAAPKWYFKFSATSGATYTLPAASKTLAATDGTGASGTWGISISGTAAKATADKNGNDITTKYVTIDTDQTITANQKTFNGAIRWGTASKYGAAHYDSTLEVIVFSFA